MADFPRIRNRIGCCSSYGLFEPAPGLCLWFDDDCRDHTREDILRMIPEEMGPADCDYWLTLEGDSFARWNWEYEGVKISQDRALEIFLGPCLKRRKEKK